MSREELKSYAKMLKDAAELFGVPIDEVFDSTSDYPDFDNDPGVNYHIGYIRGWAEGSTGRSGGELFDELLDELQE